MDGLFLTNIIYVFHYANINLFHNEYVGILQEKFGYNTSFLF